MQLFPTGEGLNQFIQESEWIFVVQSDHRQLSLHPQHIILWVQAFLNFLVDRFDVHLGQFPESLGPDMPLGRLRFLHRLIIEPQINVQFTQPVADFTREIGIELHDLINQHLFVTWRS